MRTETKPQEDTDTHLPMNVLRQIAAEAYQLGFKRGKEEGYADGKHDEREAWKQLPGYQRGHKQGYSDGARAERKSWQEQPVPDELESQMYDEWAEQRAGEAR